jgi:DNA-binding NarL/FixJ family response regulator
MKPKTASILVIEEHLLMRGSLCAAIEAEPDLSVLEAYANAADAFALQVSTQQDVLFLYQKPDLILWALGNPGLEDLQALEKLSQAWRGIPILALTRAELPGQEQEALAHGARAALTKSASRSEILQTLRTIRSI